MKLCTYRNTVESMLVVLLLVLVAANSTKTSEDVPMTTYNWRTFLGIWTLSPNVPNGWYHRQSRSAAIVRK